MIKNEILRADVALAGMLGWLDIKKRYRRSKIGPFWITLSMAVLIGSIGLVFSQILNSPIQEYLPYLATGIIVWGFISGTISEGSHAFTESENIIKQLDKPLWIYILRVVWRNLIVFVHNIAILPIIMVIFSVRVNYNLIYFLPSIILVTINISWIIFLTAFLNARFRDVANIVLSILQVSFYVTPIIWNPEHISERTSTLILRPNPFYHLLEVIRSPLIGKQPSIESIFILILMATLGWLVVFHVQKRYKRRVPYWV